MTRSRWSRAGSSDGRYGCAPMRRARRIEELVRGHAAVMDC
ncbi:hypothetical protein [Acrocarpospora catenulata]|nr:hypothetical protein [Acrocarpospora catenulata]